MRWRQWPSAVKACGLAIAMSLGFGSLADAEERTAAPAGSAASGPLAGEIARYLSVPGIEDVEVLGNEFRYFKITCDQGREIDVELAPWVQRIQWQMDGCTCAETLEKAQEQAIVGLARFADELSSGSYGGVGFSEDVPLGETNELRLYCYNLRELFEQFGGSQ